MHKILGMFMALLVGMVLLTDADAARFGGGKSSGRQYSSPAPTQTHTPAAGKTQAASAAQPASGISRWMGPLAGLAAGGLLAALLFGDGFEGVQFLDILLFAALAFGGFALFRAWRNQAAPKAAGVGPLGTGSLFQGPIGGGTAQPATTGWGQPALDRGPAWFDANTFAAGAQDHFRRLQVAWDQNNMDEIRTYTDPDLFNELSRERERLGPGPQHTEVLNIAAELVGLRREGDQLVASIGFTGLVREQRDAPPTQVAETWHVSHAWDTPKGDWYIVGIQQQGQ